MSIAELKLNIINRISVIDDVFIIKEIEKLLDLELDERVYELSNAQRTRLIEAQMDEILTEDEANGQIEEWLNEK